MLQRYFDLLEVIDYSQLSWGWKVLIIYSSVFLCLFALMTVLTIVGSLQVLRRYREIAAEDIFRILRSNSLPSITFLVPAFNESKNILQTVRTMLSLSYRYKQIIVINDGSNDSTLELLKTHFSLKSVPPTQPTIFQTEKVRSYYVSIDHPNLMVIDKENGGKADALNAGLNACTTSIYVCSDADTLIDDNALSRLIRPFLIHPDTVAAHASVNIINGCKIGPNRILEFHFPKKLVPGYQSIEYMKIFLVERMGLSWTKGACVVPGAFGMFKKDTMIAIGGYDTSAVLEDVEVITRMHEHLLRNKIEYNIAYVPDPIAWTEAPENLKVLGKQRVRWYQGTTQSVWKYRYMIFNPRYKSVGLFVCPFTVLQKLVPPFEVSAYIILAFLAYFSVVDPLFVFIYMGIGWSFGTLFFLCTVTMELLAYQTYTQWRDLLNILKCVFLYVGYHFPILWWEHRGFFLPKTGKKFKWETKRAGYDKIKSK